MSEDLTTDAAAPAPRRRPRRRTIAILSVAGLVAAGVITGTTVVYANETARQCDVALDLASTAATTSEKSVAGADSALELITSVDLPDTKGWKSTVYTDRPAVEAVEAKSASKGEKAVEAVAARPSGADFTRDVIDTRDELLAIEIAAVCGDRDEAATITAAAERTTSTATVLDERVEALTADFATFQADEKARITAEKKVAAKKAAAEKARKIAAAKKAKAAKKAAEEAARKAAASRQSSSRSGSSGYTGSRSSGSSGSSGSKGSGGSSSGSKGGGGSSGGGGSGGGSVGGGGVGGGGGPKVCRGDNGHGGSMIVPCP